MFRFEMFVWWIAKLTRDTDYKSILSPGNFKEMNIKKLWNSDVYNNLRQKHEMKSRKNIFPCKNCCVT